MTNATLIDEKEQTSAVTLITFSSTKSLIEVVAAFESELGRLDEQEAMAAHDLHAAIKSMEGPSGLMIIRVIDMDNLLPSLSSSSIRARQYLVGNPLIASKMSAFNPLAALYAPPRVLIHSQGETTWISYDKPSTVFGRLGSADILQTAEELDKKFESLARKALA